MILARACPFKMVMGDTAGASQAEQYISVSACYADI